MQFQEEQRVLQQEQRLTRVETRVEEIATNHLPHIQAGVDKVAENVKWLFRFLFTAAVGAVGTMVWYILTHPLVLK